ncbi:hypothetical protein CPB83DRAFT_756619, partial [Crepidotus variabilis]
MGKTRFDKLTDENYHEWKFFMTACLTKKALLEVVDGSKTRPSGPPNALRAFDRKQAEAEWHICMSTEARAEIILNVSKTQLSHCRADDPKVIWDNLTIVHGCSG